MNQGNVFFISVVFGVLVVVHVVEDGFLNFDWHMSSHTACHFVRLKKEVPNFITSFFLFPIMLFFEHWAHSCDKTGLRKGG